MTDARKKPPPSSSRAAALRLAERRAVLQARSRALRTALDLEVRSLDHDVGRHVDKALHWLGVARRTAGIAALVLPLLMARRKGRRGLARGVSFVGRALRAAPLGLSLVQSLRTMWRHRREAAGAPQPAAGRHD